MSVNDCVYQVFVLKMMDSEISAIKSRFGHFWWEYFSKTWHTVVHVILTGSLVSTFH